MNVQSFNKKIKNNLTDYNSLTRTSDVPRLELPLVATLLQGDQMYNMENKTLFHIDPNDKNDFEQYIVNSFQRNSIHEII